MNYILSSVPPLHLAPRPPRNLVGREPGALRVSGVAAERLIPVRVPPEFPQHFCVRLELRQKLVSKNWRVGFTSVFPEECGGAVVELYVLGVQEARRKEYGRRPGQVGGPRGEAVEEPHGHLLRRVVVSERFRRATEGIARELIEQYEARNQSRHVVPSLASQAAGARGADERNEFAAFCVQRGPAEKPPLDSLISIFLGIHATVHPLLPKPEGYHIRRLVDARRGHACCQRRSDRVLVTRLEVTDVQRERWQAVQHLQSCSKSGERF
ncbi:unnamed protein product [Pelagomonas calceolata]|uniref:Uncharacterized protein n=1 Tax=Pelagomonas calceolata TaxID=35677 RepID=A0A8J2SFD4_9STRA|nr:unnamed protein product [Pelagomonas calceolata]|mmetsp:Transcript_18453/g.48950  ORF Transcript_18453/g.48950 Transcript_18453/m.48950 type:complete len:268 (+) Transcript_18453:30-833(+)